MITGAIIMAIGVILGALLILVATSSNNSDNKENETPAIVHVHSSACGDADVS